MNGSRRNLNRNPKYISGVIPEINEGISEGIPEHILKGISGKILEIILE